MLSVYSTRLVCKGAYLPRRLWKSLHFSMFLHLLDVNLISYISVAENQSLSFLGPQQRASALVKSWLDLSEEDTSLAK